MPEPSLRALRGATTVERDDGAGILAATSELLAAMLERNAVEPGDIVSVIFTATPDLTAEFPALAARRLGVDAPLMCAREMDVPHGLARCIRVLMHLHTSAAPGDLHHVYLRGARHLRRDIAGRPEPEAP